MVGTKINNPSDFPFSRDRARHSEKEVGKVAIVIWKRGIRLSLNYLHIMCQTGLSKLAQLGSSVSRISTN